MPEASAAISPRAFLANLQHIGFDNIYDVLKSAFKFRNEDVRLLFSIYLPRIK
jgi:hypothetical protein